MTEDEDHLPPDAHSVTVYQNGIYRRWECRCGWVAEPYAYDGPSRAPEAIRHILAANREQRKGRR